MLNSAFTVLERIFNKEEIEKLSILQTQMEENGKTEKMVRDHDEKKEVESTTAKDISNRTCNRLMITFSDMKKSANGHTSSTPTVEMDVLQYTSLEDNEEHRDTFVAVKMAIH